MIDYIVRIEQYQNKRFEFLTKNFQMYRSETECPLWHLIVKVSKF